MPASDVPAQHCARLACYGHALAGRALQLHLQPLPAGELGDTHALSRLAIAEDGQAQLRLPTWSGDAAIHSAKLGWAATAHAAAHVRHGQAPQARGALKPVQTVLLGLLEDARVEHAMLRDCPGLRELWVPWHTTTHANSHSGFDALLARLSLSLLNPAYIDPHPWIARVRASVLCVDGQEWCVNDFQGLRVLASALGHEIGQMRLPFDARSYRDAAPYRDDNQHLWLPDAVDELVASPECTDTPEPAPASAVALEPPPGQVVHYPEWDSRIGRLRPDWCCVWLHDATAHRPDRCRPTPIARRLARSLVQNHTGLRVPAGRSDEGQHLHPMAAVDAHIDRLRGLTPDGRVFHGEQRAPQQLAVWLLLDTSLSMKNSAAELHALALHAVSALSWLGHRTALWALSSAGRHQVGMRCLKDWNDGGVVVGLAEQACAGSSRLGAGVRHGLAEHTKDARQHPGWRRLVIIVTDGELHDIDVHDPAYLYGDLAHCRAEALQLQVAVRGLLNEAGNAQRFKTVVGPDNCAVASTERSLPGVLRGLLAN